MGMGWMTQMWPLLGKLTETLRANPDYLLDFILSFPPHVWVSHIGGSRGRGEACLLLKWVLPLPFASLFASKLINKIFLSAHPPGLPDDCVL